MPNCMQDDDSDLEFEVECPDVSTADALDASNCVKVKNGLFGKTFQILLIVWFVSKDRLVMDLFQKFIPNDKYVRRLNFVIDGLYKF